MSQLLVVTSPELVTVGPEAIADQLLSTLRQLAPMAAPPLREARRLVTRAGAAFKRDLAVPLQLGQCDEATSRPMVRFGLLCWCACSGAEGAGAFACN